jgi:hypothetical protein
MPEIILRAASTIAMLFAEMHKRLSPTAMEGR